MGKQQTVKEFKWGKKSTLNVTITKDDETGVETLKMYAKRGRSVTRATIERDMATGALLRLNGTPMPPPSDQSSYALLTRAAAEGVAAMADKPEDTLATTYRRKRRLDENKIPEF
jgi:hypothetical protein